MNQNQNQQNEKKLPVRFNVEQQDQNIMTNDLLFTIDDQPEETFSIISNQNMTKDVQSQQQHVSTPHNHSVQISDNPIIIVNTPPIFPRSNTSSIRRSSLKANSKFPNFPVEKEFQLESKKKDGSTSSLDGSRSNVISESSHEDEEEDDEDVENSQIQNLKKDQSRKSIPDLEDEIIGQDDLKFKQLQTFIIELTLEIL